MPQSQEHQQLQDKSNNWIIILLILIALLSAVAFYFFNKGQTPEEQPVPAAIEPVDVIEAPEPVAIPEPIIEPEPDIEIEETIEEAVEVPVEPTKPVLPMLNESDNWIKEKLSALTWRKELLKLVIDDDMVRRLVVFTDNFSQGIVAYEHSPLTKPSSKFEGIAMPMETSGSDAQQEWLWDDRSANRFKLYVDFLRSYDVESLVDWYYEVKPLIDEAYAELGYPDDDFTETLQDAITRVLDADIPKGEVVLVRPSVMYKYKAEELESLSDTDKLLLRLGKENLLIIKSVLLEFSDKLGRRRGE